MAKSSPKLDRKLVIGIDGSCCFDAIDKRIVGWSCAVPYKTHHFHPDWAELNPED